MTRHLLHLLKLFLALTAGIQTGYSQAPQAFKYQSVARNSSGGVIQNSPVSIRISIRNLSETGTIIYQETHNAVTNDFGLFTLNIGTGTVNQGLFSAIDWLTGAKFVEVEGDLSGGANFSSFGTSELLSVPYALYAAHAEVPLLPNGTAAGNTPYWDGSNWMVNSANIFNNGNRVGIGTQSPVFKLDVNGHVNVSADNTYRIGNERVLGTRGTANLFLGVASGSSNTLGFSNVFAGFNSGNANSVGSQNTFVGAETGVANQDGVMNSFIGRRAGFSNTNGIENTFIGAYAGQANTSGQHNSFLGVTTGNQNTEGSENAFLGAHAGYFNDIGSFNTFVGNFSAIDNTGGNYNTIVGYEANVVSGYLSNASAFGYGATVNASNSIVIGNTSITSIGGQVGWSTFSDRRLKTDIRDNNLGLDFILRLKTVNYEYLAEGQRNKRYSGLIAQDVEDILKEIDTEFSGIVPPQNEKDFYSIRYGEFVVPLIKAVQEQEEKIEDLQRENENLRLRIERLEQLLDSN